MRRSDLFVAPAFLESFGIAALEARCAGLPVLAMRGTGITEFVADRREGLLADGDAAMAAALVEISRDAELRRGDRRAQPDDPAADRLADRAGDGSMTSTPGRRRFAQTAG